MTINTSDEQVALRARLAKEAEIIASILHTYAKDLNNWAHRNGAHYPLNIVTDSVSDAARELRKLAKTAANAGIY